MSSRSRGNTTKGEVGNHKKGTSKDEVWIKKPSEEIGRKNMAVGERHSEGQGGTV